MSNLNPTLTSTVRDLTAEGVEAVRLRVANLTKRAERLGLDAPIMDVVQTDADRFDVNIFLTLPQQGRYVIAGHIAHCGKGLDGAHHNVITAAPGYANRLPAKVRTAEHGTCEHCKVFRYRKASLIIHDTFDDRVLTVGTSCAADFAGDRLGSVSAIAQAAKIAEDFATISKDMVTWQPTRPEPTVTTADFLAATVALMRLEGFASPRYVEVYGGATTGQRAATHLGELVDHYVTEDDHGVAQVALDWFSEFVDESSRAVSDLVANVKAVTQYRNLLAQHASTVAYAVAVFMHRHDMAVHVPVADIPLTAPVDKRPTVHHTERPVKNVRRDPKWQIGDRVEVQGTVQRFMPVDGAYGPAHLIIIDVPTLDRPVKAFVRGFDTRDFVEGDDVQLRGTVADLQPYRGNPQVRLNRPHLTRTAQP